MGYNFDGKLANQCPEVQNLSVAKSVCAKCSKLLEFPKRDCVTINNLSYFTFSYIGTPHYIHETKRGKSVVYCSDYCRKKHNHRFAKRTPPNGGGLS